MKKKLLTFLFAITMAAFVTACGDDASSSRLSRSNDDSQEEDIDEDEDEDDEDSDEEDAPDEDSEEDSDEEDVEEVEEEVLDSITSYVLLENIWTPDECNTITSYNADGTILNSTVYNVNENADGYGCWYFSIDETPYVCAVGMDIDKDHDSVVVNHATNTVVWTNENYPDYYIVEVESEGDVMYGFILHNETAEALCIDLATDEVYTPASRSSHYEPLEDIDTNVWSTVYCVDEGDYYFAQSAGGEKWAYLDEDMNEIRSYPDATTFCRAGYALVSDDRETYSVIDKDYNVVIEDVIDGISASLNYHNDFFRITKNDYENALLIVK